jgi:hypothetical protein
VTRIVVLAVLAAGCLSRPAAITDAPGMGGGGGDANLGSESCTSGMIVIDDFDSGSAGACGIGSVVGQGVTIDSNQLAIDPTGTGPGPFTSGCRWAGEPFGGTGVELQSVFVLTEANDETVLAVTLGEFTLKMFVVADPVNGSYLDLGDDNTPVIASAKYNVNTTGWWRLRPAGAHTVLGEYAADPAQTWVQLGVETGVPSTASPATVEVLATQGTIDMETATLDNVETCAP